VVVYRKGSFYTAAGGVQELLRCYASLVSLQQISMFHIANVVIQGGPGVEKTSLKKIKVLRFFEVF
jgi:hypothetical protein